MKWYYILLIVVAVLIAMLFLVAWLIDKIAFGRRCDKNPRLKYFTAEDFNLSTEKINVKCGKYTLRGYIYGNAERSEKLVIFCHGMGPGQSAYTTEIAYFCNNGLSVLALDNFGCDASDGKGMRGFYSGAKSVICAIDYAKARFPDKKLVLVGHSWGAYSALVASKKRKTDGVVAISGPASPVKTLVEVAGGATKGFAKILYPFFWLLNFLKFGAGGNANAAKCANKNKTPTLILQGAEDKTVSVKSSAYYGANGNNIQKILYKDKRHNPYNTVAAEDRLQKLSETVNGYAAAVGTKDTVTAERLIGELNAFDFSAATEEDAAVMSDISQFIASI